MPQPVAARKVGPIACMLAAMTMSRGALLLGVVALVGKCSGLSSTEEPPVSREPPPAPAADVAVGTPASPILATFSRWSMVLRVLRSGETTKSPETMLVLFSNGAVEIRDGHPQGLLIAKGAVDKGRLDALRALLARPEWKELAGKRGASYPDGPMHVLEVQGKRITRYDNPDDEPVVREATAAFNEIWKGIDP